jgi:hypothetical protein
MLVLHHERGQPDETEALRQGREVEEFEGTIYATIEGPKNWFKEGDPVEQLAIKIYVDRRPVRPSSTQVIPMTTSRRWSSVQDSGATSCA